VAFDMDRYKEICGRLDYGDLDLRGAFARQPLQPELLRCLRYMHDVEQHTTCYMRNLLNTRAHERTVRLFLRKLWRPVGATVMPEPEIRHVVRTLFADDEGRDATARIDRRIDALPGLGGMQLMDGVVRRYAA
jgi:hypothetical protein